MNSQLQDKLFKMNPNHYWDSKLFNKKDNNGKDDFKQKKFSWQNHLAQLKKSNKDFSFLVIYDNKILYSDNAFGFSKIDDLLKINIEKLIHKKIYIIQIHDLQSNLNLKLTQSVFIIHENIVVNQSDSWIEIQSHKKCNYTHLVTNLYNNIFYQDITFDHHKKSSCYFLQYEQLSKNKVNQKHILHEGSCIDISCVNKLMPKQIRDDYIEIEHIEKQTNSSINYLSLNSGKSVSQINSVINELAFNSETHQHIKHLLIAENAQSFSKPTLMIDNPLVVASHGNSIGSYSEEDLFYLMQRGISLEKAKEIVQSGLIIKLFDKHYYFEKMIQYFHTGNLYE